MNGRTDKIRRLLLVLQSISLIPPIVMFIVWFNWMFTRLSTEYFVYFLLSVIPFILLILGKYIVYGKFYIFKIENHWLRNHEEEKIEKEKGMSQGENDSKVGEEKIYKSSEITSDLVEDGNQDSRGYEYIKKNGKVYQTKKKRMSQSEYDSKIEKEKEH